MNVRRYRFAIFVVLNAILLIHASAIAKAPKSWRPEVNKKTRRILNLPFPVVTKNILITKYFGCPIDKAPAQPIDNTGGFPCTAVYDVNLTVEANSNNVSVVGSSLSVRQGECIYWHVTATDGASASIDAIDFINTPAEVTPTKAQTPQDVGDYCQGALSCVMYVSIPKGVYPYHALVRHHGVVKRADPDVDVSCSGPNCDEL